MAHGVLETRQQFAGRNAQGILDPAPVREKVRDHGNGVLTRLLNQHRDVMFELLGSRRHFIDQRYTLARHDESVGHDEALQPAAQIGVGIMAGNRRRGPVCLCHSFPLVLGVAFTFENSIREISSRRAGRPRNSGRSPQRLTTPTSMSNRSSARPTVWPTMSSSESGL